jgi:hypothetical protein
MILKEQDDRIADVEALRRLLAHPRMDERGRRRIVEQIRNLESGDLGERQAAYLLKVHFGSNPNWVVINDLRIEHDGLVAQIDHLLINRLLEIWVCESKRFGDGVKINDHGEFITFRDGRPRVSQSPIQQNVRQILILQQLLDSGAVQLPTRMGFRIKPKLHSLVLIAGGVIRRPRVPVPGIDCVIMADQVKVRIDRAYESGNLLDLAKIVGQETLRNLGDQLLALNRPIQYEWERRFLPALPLTGPAAKMSPAERATASRAGQAKPQAAARAQTCDDCTSAVTSGMIQYCRKNSERFAGRLLCMPCQAKRAQPAVDRILGSGGAG